MFFSEEGSEIAVERFVQRVRRSWKASAGEEANVELKSADAKSLPEKSLSDTLPDEIASLGEPLSVHPPIREQEMHPVLGVSLLLGLAGGFMMFVPIVVAMGMHNAGEKPSDPNFHLGLIGFGGFGLILLIAGTSLWFWQSSRLANDPHTAEKKAPITYYVHEEALVLSRNGECTRLPWDDLALHQEGEWGAVLSD